MRHLILTTCLLLIAGVLTPQQGPAQNRASEQVLVWAPVKKVCGRLRTVERGVFVPVPNKELRLYEAKWRKPCCKDLKLVGTRISSASGEILISETSGLVGTGWRLNWTVYNMAHL